MSLHPACRSSSRLFAVGSQIAFSGTSFVSALTASRVLDTSDMARYAVMTTVAAWMMTFANAAICLPHAMTMPRVTNPQRRAAMRGGMRSLGVLAAVALGMLGGVISSGADLVTAAITSMFCVTFLLRHEQRSSCLAEEQNAAALAPELVTLCLALAILVSSLATTLSMPFQCYGMLCVATMVPALAIGYARGGLFPLRHGRSLRQHLRGVWHRMGLEMTKGVIPAEIMNNAYVYALSASGHAGLLTVLYGCGLCYRHVTVLTNGLASAIRQDLAKQPFLIHGRAPTSGVLASVAILLLTVTNTGLLLMLNREAVFWHASIFRSEGYEVFVWCMGVTLLAQLLSCLRMPVVLVLQAQGHLAFLTRSTVLAAAIGGGLQVVGGMSGASTMVLLGILASNGIFIALLVLKLVSVLRRTG